MRFQQQAISRFALAVVATAVLFLFAAMPAAQAAISWDAGGDSQWWFNPANWSESAAIALPPTSDADNLPTTADVVQTDALINFVPPGMLIADFNNDGKVSAADFTTWQEHVGAPTITNRDPGNTGDVGTNDFEDYLTNYGGTSGWDQGEGVVYDPANDPFFDDTDLRPDLEGMQTAANLNYPAGYGPQTIAHLYIGRNSSADALLTIKGDLDLVGDPNVSNNHMLGRSSATSSPITGRINQVSGLVRMNDRGLDLGGLDTSTTEPQPVTRWSNATYDYRSGTLEVSQSSGNGIRLSTGSTANGTSGIATFIMHNPGTPGHVRTLDLLVAASGEPTANGTTRGVGIVEFHLENGGTRPMQITRTLRLGNGIDNDANGGTRSSRLGLVLHEAPCAGEGCAPMDLGLFDVDSDTSGTGSIVKAVAEAPWDASFSDQFAADPLDEANRYDEGDTFSAIFGGIQYNWTISYEGNIFWNSTDDYNNSVVGAIEDNSTCLAESRVNCLDVVLIGVDSFAVGSGAGLVGTVPEPSSLVLIAAAAAGLFVARRRG